MDENNISEEAMSGDTARPKWQVWGARIAVVIVIVAFLLYCYHIATGGM